MPFLSLAAVAGATLLAIRTPGTLRPKSEQPTAIVADSKSGSTFPSMLLLASFAAARRPREDFAQQHEDSFPTPLAQSADCLSCAQARALVGSLDRAAIVAITDTRGRIIYANENFARVSGYTVPELLGQDHRLLNSGRHPKSFWKAMYREVAAGKIWRGEVCNRTKTGEEYWVDTAVSAVRDEAGAIRQYVALRFEITDRKQAEQELQATKDELEQALQAAADLNGELKVNNEKLSNAKSVAESAARIRSEFLANMSHEIRTPMTAIVGFAELLAEDDGENLPPEQRRESLETIWRQGKHLLSLINDVLDLAKIESGKFSTERIAVDPRAIMFETSKLLAHRARSKGIDLRCVVDGEVPDRIESDPTRLQQILTNLVGNAIKFTDKGSVELRLRVNEPKDGRSIEISVTDTGLGIDKQTLTRLFRAFEQADASTTRRFGGTGLGLRISKQLALALGGDITVQSKPGDGSTFFLTLPMAQPQLDRSQPLAALGDSDAPDQSACPEPGLPLEAVRVLLAEDGDDNAMLITHHLRKAGATVTRVINGLEAVRAIYGPEGDGPQSNAHDVLILDMQMPVMDGYTAASVLRERGCAMPIIAATAHAMEEDRARCLQVGCSDYISKPIVRRDLVRAVTEAMKTNRSDVV